MLAQQICYDGLLVPDDAMMGRVCQESNYCIDFCQVTQGLHTTYACKNFRLSLQNVICMMSVQCLVLVQSIIESDPDFYVHP